MEARGKRDPRERIMFRDQIPPESYNKLASHVVVEKVPAIDPRSGDI